MSSKNQNLTKEQIKRIQRQQKREDPRFWFRYSLNHPNRPQDGYDFRTDDGEKLRYLTDDEGPLNPEQWGDIVILLMARGCLKTTSVTGITGWMLDQYPNSEAFMTAPRKDQVKHFVKGFRNNLKDTSLEERRVKNTYGQQGFETKVKDQNGDSLTLNSALVTKSAWGEGDGLRGPHSQLGIADEFQDINSETFSVFLEIIDQSIPEKPDTFPTTFVIGTPKLTSSFFDQLWSLSDRKTWDDDAGEWIQQDDVGAYAPPEVCGVCGSNVDATYDECPECGTEVESSVDPFTVTGFHIDQPNCPLHDEAEIEFKRQNYSEQRFKNEVLAQFYSPEDNFLAERHVRQIFDDYDGQGRHGFVNERQHNDSNVAITVDWGGGQGADSSDTTITVGEMVEQDDEEHPYTINTLDHTFVDHDVTQTEEENMVRRAISKFRPDVVLVDEGYQGQRRQNLQTDYPETVYGVNFGRVTPSEDLKWRENEKGNEVLFTADKGYCSESMVDAVKNELFSIPTKDLTFGSKKSNGTKLLSQLTATAKDYKTTPSGTKKLGIISERNDDAFDTFVYQWIAHRKMNTDPGLTEFSLNNRIGY